MDIVNATEICTLVCDKENQIENADYDKKLATLFQKYKS